MTTKPAGEARIPIIREDVVVTKSDAISDRVRVRTIADTRDVVVEDVVRRGSIEVERVAIDREVEEAPLPRQEGDLLVVSIIEERLVKRLFVVEELRVRQQTKVEPLSMPVTLRTMRAVVDHGQHPTPGEFTDGQP